LILSCKVKTFSILNERSFGKFTRKTQKSIEQGKTAAYEVNGDFVVRKVNHDHYEYYINRTYKTAGKNTINYFAIDASDHKTAEIFRLLRRVNNADGDCLELSFMDVEYNRLMEVKRHQNDIFQAILNNYPKDVVINVIDNCNQKEKIIMLLEKIGVAYTLSCQPIPEMLNLSIVKSKSEYELLAEEDKYIKDNHCVIQNVETKHLTDTVIKQCLLEFVIKREAVNEEIYTVNLKGNWDFYQIINKSVHRLSIKDNKIIGISSINVNPEISERLSSMIGADPKMIVHDSDSIIILDTDIRLMPNWNDFVLAKEKYIEVNNNKTINKARSHRNSLFGEIIDVNSFAISSKKYYSVGEIGYGMNTIISNSPATKEVIEDGLMIEDICFMMLPNIYQVNKYAVYPYPYKLMNEIFRMNGGVIAND